MPALWSRDFLSRWVGGWLPFLAANLVLIHGSLLPLSQIPRWLGSFDDFVLHAVNYFVLALLSVNAFCRAQSPALSRHPRKWAFAWAFILGVVLEVLQAGVPGRATSVADMAANAFGAGVGIGSFTVWQRYKRVVR